MKRSPRPAGVLALLVMSLVVAPAAASAAAPAGRKAGYVYTATNATTGNSLLVFERNRRGVLVAAGSYPSGGTGTGAALGSGHSVVVSAHGRVVMVVNAGSNSISAFVRHFGSLHRIGAAVDSGGTTPTSVTIRGDLVYVMNAGSGSIAGFRLDLRRGLIPIPGSTQPLSAAGTDVDSQIQFDRRGRVLIVDERGTADVLQTFVSVDTGGQAAADNPLRGADRSGSMSTSEATFFSRTSRSAIRAAPAPTTFLGAASWLRTARRSRPVNLRPAGWRQTVPTRTRRTRAAGRSLRSRSPETARSVSSARPLSRRTPNLSTTSASPTTIFFTCSRPA